MKRLITPVISVALVAGAISAHPSIADRYHPLSVHSGLRQIAVIGDSYTTGSDEGGRGPNTWTARAWRMLARSGVQIAADVEAEGGAGYVTRGNHGDVFKELTVRAVQPEDTLVVFFGSRNDQGADGAALAGAIGEDLSLAQRAAPTAKLLVIGPPWPTALPPPAMLQIRDTLSAQARAAGAVFVDPIAAGWFVGRPDLIGGDGVHPNDAGHVYMADKIAPLISSALPKLP